MSAELTDMTTCPPRVGDLAGIRSQAEKNGSSLQKAAHNAAVSAYGAGWCPSSSTEHIPHDLHFAS